LRLRSGEVVVCLEDPIDALAAYPEHLGDLRDTDEVVRHSRTVTLTTDTGAYRVSVDT
jgi:hypothetical protein